MNEKIWHHSVLLVLEQKPCETCLSISSSLVTMILISMLQQQHHAQNDILIMLVGKRTDLIWPVLINKNWNLPYHLRFNSWKYISKIWVVGINFDSRLMTWTNCTGRSLLDAVYQISKFQVLQFWRRFRKDPAFKIYCSSCDPDMHWTSTIWINSDRASCKERPWQDLLNFAKWYQVCRFKRKVDDHKSSPRATLCSGKLKRIAREKNVNTANQIWFKLKSANILDDWRETDILLVCFIGL